MSVLKVNETRRGRSSKQNKMIAELYREGKCRECSVSVTRMDFAKILGKFTKVKIQYESTPRSERLEKKITSPISNARLRSNENGMVLIHRSAYREHPAKPELAAEQAAPAPRRRGRPPKNKPAEPQVTQYRIVFADRRDSLGAPATSEAGLADILPALTVDVLPTAEWFVDYLLQDEPRNDRVYDRIAAQLEDLMYNEKPSADLEPGPARDKSDQAKPSQDDFPSIMDLLSDAIEKREMDTEKPASEEVPAANNGDAQAETAEPPRPDENKGLDEKEGEQMEVDPISNNADAPDSKTESPSHIETEATSTPQEPIKHNLESPKINGKLTLMGDQHVDLETINCIIFKKVKDDKCHRLVKCCKSLDYSVEIDGHPVKLIGAPRHFSCVEDLRLMLQIVDESNLNSFNIVEGG